MEIDGTKYGVKDEMGGEFIRSVSGAVIRYYPNVKSNTYYFRELGEIQTETQPKERWSDAAPLLSQAAEVDEKAVLDGVARRYWKQHARVEPQRRLPRLWAFLVRRGFPPGLVRERLSALWPRWSDALLGLEPTEEPAGERE